MDGGERPALTCSPISCEMLCAIRALSLALPSQPAQIASAASTLFIEAIAPNEMMEEMKIKNWEKKMRKDSKG